MRPPGVVRREYEVLARDFGALAGHFALAVSPRLEEELVLLIACFEAIDRHVDDTADAGARARMGEAVLESLRGAPARDVPDELRPLLEELRAVLLARAAEGPFAGALASFFVSSEELRTTRADDAFVRCVLEESSAAAEMALLVADRLRSATFDRFFVVLSEVANLVDKLQDVRGDRRRGEIAVRPGVRLHARLAVALAARVIRLLWLSPRPLRLVAWGARYLLPHSSLG